MMNTFAPPPLQCPLNRPASTPSKTKQPQKILSKHTTKTPDQQKLYTRIYL